MIYDFDRRPSAESMLCMLCMRCPIEQCLASSGMRCSLYLCGLCPLSLTVSDGHFKVVGIRRAHVALSEKTTY